MAAGLFNHSQRHLLFLMFFNKSNKIFKINKYV